MIATVLKTERKKFLWRKIFPRSTKNAQTGRYLIMIVLLLFLLVVVLFIIMNLSNKGFGIADGLKNLLPFG